MRYRVDDRDEVPLAREKTLYYQREGTEDRTRNEDVYSLGRKKTKKTKKKKKKKKKKKRVRRRERGRVIGKWRWPLSSLHRVPLPPTQPDRIKLLGDGRKYRGSTPFALLSKRNERRPTGDWLLERERLRV